MQTTPRITVCIPHLPERTDLLDRARASVAAQTLRPTSVLVVPDRGQGRVAVRNTLLAEARTPLVAFLDDDDEMLPNHLELLYRTWRLRPADLAWSPPEVVGADYEASFIETGWLASTAVLRHAGGWREPQPGSWADYYEDYGLLLRLIKAGRTFAKVHTYTWRHHIHPGNTHGTKPFPGVIHDQPPRTRS